MATGFYVASGIVQNLGLAMVLIGATVQRPFFTAVDVAGTPIRLSLGLGSVTVSGDFK